MFEESEQPEISFRWVEQLMQTASSSGGIMLVDEVLDPAEIEGAEKPALSS